MTSRKQDPKRDEPITRFISMCRTSGTGYAYRTGILRFLDYIYGGRVGGRYATKEEFAEYEKRASKYLQEKRDNAVDLFGFIRDMSETGTPPKTINARQCGVRQWLVDNDIEFTEKEKQRLRRIKPRGGRRTNIKYADIQIVRDILGQGDTRLRAIVLVLAVTGLRISEVLNLRWSQVRIPDRTQEANRNKLTELFVIDSKSQTSRRIWITREAEEALLAWKIATPTYLTATEGRCGNLGVERRRREDFLFPYGKEAVYTMWDKACKKSGHYSYDEKTHRTQINIHRLRGFFKTQTMPIVGSEISELLMGHCDAYGNAYNGLPEAKLEQEYRKCEGALTIASKHGISHTVEQQAHEINNLRTELAEMRFILTRLTALTTGNAENFRGLDIQKQHDDTVIFEIKDASGQKTLNRIHLQDQP